jgi:hypothetical protein
MSRKPRSKKILTIIGLVIVAAFLIWVLMQGRKEVTTELKQGRSAKVPARVLVQNGQRVITLDKEAQARSGIAVAPLKPISHREELQAYGTVLELQSLVDLRTTLIHSRKTLVDERNSYAAAKAQVEKTRASLDASSKQYERLKVLYEENQNVSAKTFQAAEVTWRSDQANSQAAQEALDASEKLMGATEEALQTLEGRALQQWGAVITKWLFDNSPVFEQLIRQQNFLIQITLPSGVQISSAPQSVHVQTASGTVLSANLVSPSPRTDPRIQGISFFYLAPASGINLLPGMNVVASMPAGPQARGFFISGSAIVWSQGKAWVYIQKGEEQFVRQRVTTKTPAKDGYFVTKGFKRGERIVVKGAQLLLSEEFLTKAQTGEEDED